MSHLRELTPAFLWRRLWTSWKGLDGIDGGRLHFPSDQAHANAGSLLPGGAGALWDWMSLKMDNRDAAGNSPRLPSGALLGARDCTFPFTLLSVADPTRGLPASAPRQPSVTACAAPSPPETPGSGCWPPPPGAENTAASPKPWAPSGPRAGLPSELPSGRRHPQRPPGLPCCLARSLPGGSCLWLGSRFVGKKNLRFRTALVQPEHDFPRPPSPTLTRG